MICEECGGEFRDGIEECPDCKVPLVDAPSEPEPSLEMVDAVTVDTFHDTSSARIALTVLENAGIRAWLCDEQTVGVDWLLAPAIGGARLQTSAEDAEAAKQVLRAMAGDGPEIQQDDTPELAEGSPDPEYWESKHQSRWARGMVALLIVSPVVFLGAMFLSLFKGPKAS